ncbi:hypothetical protein CMV_024429, partial [Castanea mollissima]
MSSLLCPQPKKLALPTQHWGCPLHSMLTPTRGWLFRKLIPTTLTTRNFLEREKKKKKNVGILSDIAASDDGDGCDDLEVFRGSPCPQIRSLHRWIHLVLLSLSHHPRTRRHLDHNNGPLQWRDIFLLELFILEYFFTYLMKNCLMQYWIYVQE